MSRKEVTLKLKKLDDRAVIPTYAHVDDDGKNEGDIGMDMIAISAEWDEKMDCYIYHTGLAMETAKGFGTFLFPRSSNRKTDCYLTNSVGLADTTLYRGELLWCFKSRTSTYQRAETIGMKVFMDSIFKSLKNPFNLFKIKKVLNKAMKNYEEAKERVFEMTKNLEFAPYEVGKKIGQMVVIPYPDVNIQLVSELSETSRGTGGFGSTDEK
jgi:dUTP pyrophosphatase